MANKVSTVATNYIYTQSFRYTDIYSNDRFRYNGSTGLAPASLLALTDINTLDTEISEEEKMSLSIVSHPKLYPCMV